MAVNYLQISNISAILKKIIIPVIKEQMNKEAVLFNKIKRNSGVTIANNSIYLAARTNRHSGIYTVAEGNEPRTGKATYDQPYASIKYAFGTLELTDQAIEAASNSDKKAIAAILATEVTALKDDFRKDLNRQMWGDGTGQLCLCNGTASTAGTALIVDSPGTRYLTPGMYVVIGSEAATQITAVTASTTATLATATAWADNAIIRKEYASGSSYNEFMGLKGIIDTGTYVTTIQNIVRSSNSWAQSHADDASGSLTEAGMITQYMNCLEYGKPDVWFFGPYGFSRYGNLLTSMKKTASLQEVLAGGWKGLEFMDIGVMLDYDCPETSSNDAFAFLVDFDALTIAEMTDPLKWLEADAHGGILKRSASNRTIWEGTLKYYANLVANKFKSMARMKKNV